MQLYIATYFICKMLIGESVMLRTLHKMLQTLHVQYTLNLIYQNYKICRYFASTYCNYTGSLLFIVNILASWSKLLTKCVIFSLFVWNSPYTGMQCLPCSNILLFYFFSWDFIGTARKTYKCYWKAYQHWKFSCLSGIWLWIIFKIHYFDFIGSSGK